jgi:hypothetical protein
MAHVLPRALRISPRILRVIVLAFLSQHDVHADGEIQRP